MKYTLLTPGPTPIPPSVLAKLAEPILHHRTNEFGAYFMDVIERLKRIYLTKNAVLVMSCSGTGGMESAVANLVGPGDKTMVASAGAFGDRWGKLLKAYGHSPRMLQVEWGRAVDPGEFEKALKEEGKDLACVFLTHTDTSTGVVNDLKALSRLVRRHSDALVVVDAVSGLGGEELRTDEWDLDVVVSASQKGLMNAPGLAFVSVSEKAWGKAERAAGPRFYFDWRSMRDSLPKKETPFTPAVGLVVAQAEALRLMEEEGLERIWARTAQLAEFTREKIQGLGFALFPKNPCRILTAAVVPPGIDGKALVKRLREEYSVSIAGGQLHLMGKIVRLAHMGYIRRPDLERGFEALGDLLRKLSPAASPS